MTSLLPTEVTTITLAATVTDRTALYRIAQSLLALHNAPGLRRLQLSRHRTEWSAYGVTPTTTEFAPAALSLDAGLSHRAHLNAMLLAPLAVEVPRGTTRPPQLTSFAVQFDDLPGLFEATRALAAALDAREAAQQGSVFTRRSRQAQAAQHVVAALEALRDAADQVELIPLQ